MENIFFFQTKQIHDNTNLFDQFKKQKIFYSYFQVDQNYYLFIYSQTNIQIDFLYPLVQVIQELDSKQRKIRSLRGFFLYALEILEKGGDYEILDTNLQPFFWRKVKNIIRQNKKSALQEFLFGNKYDNKDSNPKIKILKDQIQSLHNQVERLQQKVIQLEILLKNSKYALSDPLESPNVRKTIQQDESTLKTESSLQSPYLTSNDPKRSALLNEVRNPTSQTKDMESKSVSEGSKMDFKISERSEQYNIVSDQFKPQNNSNFIALGKISEDEKIEIIQLGFQRQAERKISLKKYYESTDSNSLFQLKGYRIKYEAIRKNKFYQQLKQ